MKLFVAKLISVAIGILAVAIHQSYTLEDEDYSGELPESPVNLNRLRSLTVEEEALANDAREHISKTIENNLVRLFAVVSAKRVRQARQEDGDGDGGVDVEDLAAVTPNPNVLPQVAQILGAIFSGSLNITRVVDQTFGLVPNLVRNQVGGLVKLLTGETMEEVAATTLATPTDPPTAPPQPQPIVVTPPAPAGGPVEHVIAQSAITEPPAPPPLPPSAATPAQETTKRSIAVETNVDDEEVVSVNPKLTETTQASVGEAVEVTTEKGKYKVKPRTRPSTTPIPHLLEDDEIEKLEEDLRRAARDYEPYVRDKQPRFFASAFRRVFSRVDFNMTEIARAVPSIFKGARQAFTVLENLGILDVNDVLDELDIPNLEEEEE